MVLDGAAHRDGKLVLNDGESVRIGKAQVRWTQMSVQDQGKEKSSSRGSLVNLPVYLNTERSDVLFTVDLPFEHGVERLVAIRAVCLTAGG